MIGQGKVLASPLTVATVSASVAAGARVAPRLVVDPAPSAGAAGGARPLDKGNVSTLQDLMRAVVTQGTGTALVGVPGGAVHGKTGTAEFGSKDPPDTHAWFTGYQGDLAFAVHRRGRRVRRPGRGPARRGLPHPPALLTSLADHALRGDHARHVHRREVHDQRRGQAPAVSARIASWTHWARPGARSS